MKRVRDTELGEEGFFIPFDLFDYSFLTHLLSYAWRSYYRLALTCRRFLDITRSREYWQALARQALKAHVPPQNLHQIDWLHGLKDGEPFHFYLWALWTQRPGAFSVSRVEGGSIEFCSSEMRQIETYPSFVQSWRIDFADKDEPAGRFTTSIRSLRIFNDEGFILPSEMPWYITHWNNPLIFKEIITRNSREKKVARIYVEIPVGNKIWCGAIENPIFRDREKMDPSSWVPKIGFGVWK